MYIPDRGDTQEFFSPKMKTKPKHAEMMNKNSFYLVFKQIYDLFEGIL